MPKFVTTFEIESKYANLIDIFTALKALGARDVKFTPPRKPLSLGDYNPDLIRPTEGDENYRVVIPGLGKNGSEATVPVWEDDLDEDLLEEILANQNLNRFGF